MIFINYSTCSLLPQELLVVVVGKAHHGETNIYNHVLNFYEGIIDVSPHFYEGIAVQKYKLQYHSPEPVAKHAHVSFLTVGAEDNHLSSVGQCGTEAHSLIIGKT